VPKEPHKKAIWIEVYPIGTYSGRSRRPYSGCAAKNGVYVLRFQLLRLTIRGDGLNEVGVKSALSRRRGNKQSF
jgi:hypothetical protein